MVYHYVLYTSINDKNDPEYKDYDDDAFIDENEIAFNGRCIIYEKKDEYFRENGYISNILINPTYGDLLLEADKQIEATEDFHHVFFEGFSVKKQIGPDLYEIELCLES